CGLCTCAAPRRIRAAESRAFPATTWRARSRRTGVASRSSMSVHSRKRRLSRAVIASAEWYARLGALCAGSFTTATMIGLADELVDRLNVDSILILRYPKAASPQLLYGRPDHKHRANTVEDYLLGHYALDPFYLRSEYCSQQGLVSLRDVIEEDFASSEY